MVFMGDQKGIFGKKWLNPMNEMLMLELFPKLVNGY